jgi:hypothetical protein
MPTNLLKTYNTHLDIAGLSVGDRLASLLRVFDRDITNNQPFKFRNRNIIPTPKDGDISMSTLFRHLTTEVIDQKTKKREFEINRSKRLHWVRHHIDNKKTNLLCFTVKEPDGFRTYLYDDDEKYVIVLEPRVPYNTYFLLSAYHLRGKDAQRDKIKKKYKRRHDEIL